MKKKRLFGLLLLAPLGLLAGCGGTMTLGFSPNWYYENTTENITGKSERLQYAVTFAPDQSDGVNLEYREGTYVTELSPDTASSMPVYRLHSEFNIAGRYTYGSERGDMFEDFMESTVWFTKASEGLHPIKSEKRVHATVPSTEGGTETWFTTYEFTYNVNYAEDLSSAEYTLDITAPESRKRTVTETVKLGGKETFLDNEEIAIALRGLSLPTSAYFKTIDPQTQRAIGVNVASESVTAPVSFELNGEHVEESIDAVKVSCTYDAKQRGATRNFVYAARSDDNSKKYRSVLLSFEYDVMYSLGTMTYTLKDATFEDR